MKGDQLKEPISDEMRSGVRGKHKRDAGWAARLGLLEPSSTLSYPCTAKCGFWLAADSCSPFSAEVARQMHPGVRRSWI